MGIKSGPKRTAKSTGKKDKRQSVTQENKAKHPSLNTHHHTPSD